MSLLRHLILPVLCLALAFTSSASPKTQENASQFTLWQLPNQTHSQIMSYVLRTSHGQLVVIDGGVTGDAAYLKGFLAALGNEVEAWIITHAHDDHFGALIPLLNGPEMPRVKAFYGSMPDVDWVKAHGTGDPDAKPYQELLAALRKKQMTISELSLGAKFSIDGVRFEVLGIKNLEITANAINNSSLVFRVEDSKKSVLFLGDLGPQGGQKLLRSPYAKRLPADYVQMAHHGQAGVDEAFYRAIGAKYCLWPTPLWLWDNNSGKGKNSGPWQTLHVRSWMDKLSIQQHYVMTNGLIRID